MRDAQSFGQQISRQDAPRKVLRATVFEAGKGTAGVELADGVRLRRVPASGTLTVGDVVDVEISGGSARILTAGQFTGGALQVDGASPSLSTGAPSPHDLLGAHHTLPTLGSGLVLASPYASSGTPSFRALGVNDLPTMNVVAGNGLTGGGDIRGNPTLNLAVANTGATGLTVEADAVRLTSSSAPGAAASILASDASGILTLPQFTATTKVRTPTIDTASGALTLSPASDVVLTPTSNLVKLSSSVALQSSNYASQTTGMRINYAGEGDFRYLFTDELHAKSFIADLEQALAGGQIIAKSVAILYSAFTMPAGGSSGTFVVRDLPSATGMRVFEDRDIVRFRSFSRSAGALSITDAWGEVTLDTSYGTSGFDSATKTQRYTYLRRQSVTIDDQNNEIITDSTGDAILSSNITTPEGSMSGGTVIAADSIVLDYGKNASGIHEINAIDGTYGVNSPYAQTISWQIHPKNSTVRTRIGNLRGIFSIDNEFGIFAGTGTSTSDQYFKASSEGVSLANVPLALYRNGSQRVNIDSDGVDVWFSSNGGTTKQFYWNGSALALNDASLNLTGSGLITLAGTGSVTMSSTGILGTNSSGKPSFSLINSTQTINGESLAAGDTMFGDNSSGKPNLLFDESAAQLKIRGGTTTQAYIDTDGSIMAGGGHVEINSDGVFLAGDYQPGYGTAGSLQTRPTARLYLGLSTTVAPYIYGTTTINNAQTNYSGKITMMMPAAGSGGSTREFILDGYANEMLWDGSIAYGVRVPRSSGSALFAVDTSSTGSTFALANNATTNLFGSTAFVGLLQITNNSSGASAFVMVSYFATTIVSDPSGVFSNASGTASKTNVYKSGTGQPVVVENKTGGTVTYAAMAFRIA